MSLLGLVVLGGIVLASGALKDWGGFPLAQTTREPAVMSPQPPPAETLPAGATPAGKTPVAATPKPPPDTPAPTHTPDRAAREQALLRTLQYRSQNGAPVFAYRVEQPPTLDGRLTEWTGERALVPYLVYTAKDGDWTGTADLSGAFYVAWDEDFLYLGAEVTDDLHVQTQTGAKLYQGDDIEIQVDADLAGDFSSDALSDDDGQLGFSPGDWDALRPEAYIWRPPALEQPGSMIRLAARAVGPGYVLEAAIPWWVLGGRPALETAVGFCLSLSDNDAPGAAAQQTLLSTSAARKRGDPTTWGTLIIVDWK